MNVQKNYKNTFNLMAHFAVAAMFAMGFLLIPALTASAQTRKTYDMSQYKDPVGIRSTSDQATPEMLSYALNIKADNLPASMNAIKQLPCENIDSQLGGKTLKAGVYCLASADLADKLVLDGAGSTSSIFVFKVAGTLNAKANSSIELANGAQAANIFFVGDTVNVKSGANFKGNILTNKAINVESGAMVKGRTLSVSGEVNAPQEALAPQQTGVLEICKSVTGPGLENRVFFFTVTGVTGNIEVAGGQCSAPFAVPAGPATITELPNGRLLNGTATNGNFVMTGVTTLSQNSSSRLTGTNLPLRTANVNIVDDGGGISTQLTLNITNTFAITGYVEICKSAALVADGSGNPDPDVTGFFNFTIQGVFNQPNSTQLQVFTAPVGGCTGAIGVTVAADPSTGPPRYADVRVTEIGRPGFTLEDIVTYPSNRDPDGAGDEVFTADGGGYDIIRVIEGAPATESLVNFINRTNPGSVKVCKIAGPGIPEGTPFTFNVTGYPTASSTDPVTRTVTVLAGPAASGGFCQFVPGATAGSIQGFDIGEAVLIEEVAPRSINGIPGEVRTSRIRSTSFFLDSNGNPIGADLNRNADRISAVVVPARASVIEVEFTNFIFRPTILKVCKIAGTGITMNTQFTFDVTFNPAQGAGGDLAPGFTTPVTVTAGPASQGGYCTIVDGSGLLGGAFNIGSSVTVTERGSGNTVVSNITSNTSSFTPAFTPGSRSATLSGGNGLIAGVNILTFTNTAGTPTPIAPTAFDFDGDGKADVAVYRGSEGNWYSMDSNNGFNAANFGASTDRIVPGDYDGDGKTDIAVTRVVNNSIMWYLNRSSQGFIGMEFGQAGDIPVPANYSGSGKSDIAVFRPSNGTWYIYNLTTNKTSAVQFGQAGDVPVPADYDGDGKADISVFRAASGFWYRINSSTNQWSSIQFGQNGDKAVPADYDGDGKTDIAVYRSGTWYMLKSKDGFSGVAFGDVNDIPVPADYDGDGKADIGVYRPSNGTWYMQETTAGFAGVQFGASTDKPVEAAFLQ